MKSLRKLLDRARPSFERGARFGAFHSVFEGLESFLFSSKETSKPGMTHIHDSLDSKRIMTTVIIALMPCFIFGMYNTGYQHWLAAGETSFPFFSLLLYGFLKVLPLVAVTYLV
ncbi:MAG: RnfABCDGE type electron transport complex subunit D, partial [Muribaculaceae bacterium]|nr:RnfABCDGE type electron transport complex subunit D [Muribaculaceae bacterium]